MGEFECPATELTCCGKPHNEDLSRFLELGREGLQKEQLCGGAVPVEGKTTPPGCLHRSGLTCVDNGETRSWLFDRKSKELRVSAHYWRARILLEK